MRIQSFTLIEETGRRLEKLAMAGIGKLHYVTPYTYDVIRKVLYNIVQPILLYVID